MDSYVIAGVIVIFSFALISVGRYRSFHISRSGAALLGGLLMIVFNIIPFSAIPEVVSSNLSTLLLLIGMMMIAGSLNESGFFRILTEKMEAVSGNAEEIFIYMTMAVALLSAIVLNDAVVLIATPLIIKMAKTRGYNPVPFLLGLAFAANIGSSATITGNPQNAYIGTYHGALSIGFDFNYFTLMMLPVSVASLIVMMLVMLRYSNFTINDKSTYRSRKGGDTNRTGIIASVTIMVAALASFPFDSYFHASIGVIAFFFGAVSLIVVPLVSRIDPKTIVKNVDWNIILLFIGLFILLQGVESSGMVSAILAALGGSAILSNIFYLSLITAALSTFISNVPSVILLMHVVTPSRISYLVLSASSTLSGNATILSAAANIIVLEKAREEGIEIPFWTFVKYGLPIAVVTVAIATLFIYLNL